MKNSFEKFMNHIPLIGNFAKLLISAALLIFAFVVSKIRPNSIDGSICLIAMLFSFFGDIALNCIPLNKRPHSLLYLGACFFMVSHLIYASAFHLLITDSSSKFLNIGTFIAIGILIVILISTICIFSKNKNTLKKSMIFIFSIYLCIIGYNFLTIFSYSWNFKAFTWIGAVSFLISDYIIGIENVFKIKNDTLRKLVWIFYPIGQILILACR